MARSWACCKTCGHVVVTVLHMGNRAAMALANAWLFLQLTKQPIASCLGPLLDVNILLACSFNTTSVRCLCCAFKCVSVQSCSCTALQMQDALPHALPIAAPMPGNAGGTDMRNMNVHLKDSLHLLLDAGAHLPRFAGRQYH